MEYGTQVLELLTEINETSAINVKSRRVCSVLLHKAIVTIYFRGVTPYAHEPGTTAVADKLGSTFLAGRLPTDDVG